MSEKPADEPELIRLKGDIEYTPRRSGCGMIGIGLFALAGMTTAAQSRSWLLAIGPALVAVVTLPLGIWIFVRSLRGPRLVIRERRKK